MKLLQRTGLVICAAVLAAWLCFGQLGPTGFAPVEQWQAAVESGDVTRLTELYSKQPPPQLIVGKGTVESLRDEVQFWSGLRGLGFGRIFAKELSVENTGVQARVILRIEAMKSNQRMVGDALQIWLRRDGAWRIAASQRSEGLVPAAVRTLPEPEKPNVQLYADPREAHADLQRALAQAGQERKRVLVVFGANWCYDCHVLDKTFHSPGFAPLVNANYVVVHVNIGDEGKDNTDLAVRFGVNLEKGVPSLAVLDPDGKVVVAQQNGEFESTVKIGPTDVRAFLEKWKPRK